jgi:uncharacterized membrane protein YgcG
MNKKSYVKPQVEVVKVNMSCQILAGSEVSGLSGNAGFSLGGGSSTGGRSRDYDDWDEE